MRDTINLNHGNKKPPRKEVKKAIEQLLPAFRYAGGYTSSAGSVILECRKCKARIERSMVTIRRGKCIKACPTCTAREKEERKRQEAEAKRLAAEKKEAEREAARLKAAEQRTPRPCKYCGRMFTPGPRWSYCSAECARKVENNHKDRRLHGQEGRSWDITVPALVQRDNNICYLCGEQCDSNDYSITTDGYFVAGGNYPSIDHVIPVSKGGLHRWDNVRLAHLRCNMRKRDRLPESDPPP